MSSASSTGRSPLTYAVAQLAIGAGVLIAYPYGVRTVLMFLTICFAGFTLLTIPGP